MPSLNKIKLYKKANIKKCSICNKDITIKEVIENEIEVTITKRKTIILTHKSCIERRRNNGRRNSRRTRKNIHNTN